MSSLEPFLPEELGEGRSHWTPSPAIPIFSLFPEVIGVAELVNKINGPWFSKFDEDLATAFSIYCGISIAHVRERYWGREGVLLLSPTSAFFALACLCSGLRSQRAGCYAAHHTCWLPLVVQHAKLGILFLVLSNQLLRIMKEKGKETKQIKTPPSSAGLDGYIYGST